MLNTKVHRSFLCIRKNLQPLLYYNSMESQPWVLLYLVHQGRGQPQPNEPHPHEPHPLEPHPHEPHPHEPHPPETHPHEPHPPYFMEITQYHRVR